MTDNSQNVEWEGDMSGRQPIETAPKDGTPVLLLDNNSSFKPQYTGWRWDDANEWVIWSSENCIVKVKDITHWMPLPEPPKQEHEL